MAGIYTAEMGQPPMDPEVAPPSPKKKPAPKVPVKKAPVKKAESSDGIFREGMQVPQDVDGASVKYAKGGSVGSASRRADGIAKKGKTKGRML